MVTKHNLIGDQYPHKNALVAYHFLLKQASSSMYKVLVRSIAVNSLVSLEHFCDLRCLSFACLSALINKDFGLVV